MERIHLWEWRDAKIHCSEWPESPFDQHTQCLYTTKALVLVVSFHPLEHAVAFHITHDLILNVEWGRSNRLKMNKVTGCCRNFKTWWGGGGEKGGVRSVTNPKGQIGTPKGKRATYFVQLLRPGGKGVTDGVTDRVMGSLKANCLKERCCKCMGVGSSCYD